MADHLALQPLHARLAFIALAAAGGFGVILYAALWVVLPQESAVPTGGQPAGVAAHTRKGLRRDRPRRRRQDTGQLVSIAVLAVGVIAIYPHLGGVSAQVFWPLILGGVGLALLWRQADESQRARWTSAAPPRWKWLWPLVSTGGWVMVLRSVVGLTLVVAALSWGLASLGGMNEVNAALLAVLGAVVGVGLIVGPFLWRMTGDLSEERRARIRTQERADMAAHLHDSVLQTLALIQKQAHDQRAVVRLARRQERDLRQWLYGEQEDADATLRSELRRAAAEVEDHHEIPVEVVMVGDAPIDDRLTAVVRAAREAMVNAAKHSGCPSRRRLRRGRARPDRGLRPRPRRRFRPRPGGRGPPGCAAKHLRTHGAPRRQGRRTKHTGRGNRGETRRGPQTLQRGTGRPMSSPAATRHDPPSLHD